MKNIYRRKKGMTLIEAIISVALFSILIISISGLIMTAFQTSKKAESKQRASYIGQSILEEFTVYNKVLVTESTDTRKKSFKLLDNDEVYEIEKYEEYLGEFVREGFDVTVSLIKDEKFDYRMDIDKDMDLTFDIRNGDERGAFITYNNHQQTMPSSLVLTINRNEMTMGDGIKNIFTEYKTANMKNTVMINLEKDFRHNMAIKIINKDPKETVKVYVYNKQASLGDVIISSENNNVKIYSNLTNISNGETGDLYNIKVNVKKDNNILFTGEINKNIIFE